MRVLIVSPDSGVLDLLRVLLRDLSEVTSIDLATSVVGAEVVVADTPPDVVVATMTHPDGSIFDLLRRLREVEEDVQPVVLVDHDLRGATRELVRAGASDVVPLPELTRDRLVHTLVQTVERHARVRRADRDVSQLELAVRMFEQFAQTVAHDVRRPLSAIQMLADVLGDGGRGSLSVPDVAARIGQQAGRLLDFTEELLADARRMSDDRRQRIDLPLLVSDVLGLLDGLDPERVTVVSDGVELWAREGQLRQALLNVLANSLRHGGPQVRIWITCEMVGDDALIVIDDDGPGIPESDRARASVPGVRLGTDVSGHGLGLATVDLIMQGHGGSVELADAPSRGLRVTLRFPVRNVRVIEVTDAPGPQAPTAVVAGDLRR